MLFSADQSKLHYKRLVATLFVFLYAVYYLFSLSDWHFIDNVNLIIHEAGHSILFFLGDFIRISAGSLFQVLIPTLFVAYFFIQKQYFSASLLLFWVGQNFVNVSVYARDSVVMQLPLLGGDNVVHDWNYMLMHLNLLGSTEIIANGIYLLGVFIIIAGCVLSLFFSFEKESLNK
ncbi:MAG: hypothetical protein PHV42_01690 [Candidatus Pacebacteria bacterium]|nr:hypothetical protein [Candidatus Paceibacterota bacterium]